MLTLVLLAGSNGAGKTTFINGFLRERAEAFQPVNPDEVARPFFRHPPASRVFAAQTGGPSGAREREPVADAKP
jgi:predicted ABC-type ATPase